METKKSSRADIDKRRTQNFLLGMVVAVAMLFVALEYRWDMSDEVDYDTLDDIVRELDLQALKEDEERIPLIKQPVVEAPVSNEKLNVVDDHEELPEEKPLTPPENNAELKTVEQVLRSYGIVAGKDFIVEDLKRKTPSRLYELS